MKRRSKRTALPRVTVLAFSRKDLAAFAQAVESLGLHVRDLQAVVEALRSTSGKPRRTQLVKPAPAVPPRAEVHHDSE